MKGKSEVGLRDYCWNTLKIFNLVMFYFLGLVLVFAASDSFGWSPGTTVSMFVVFTFWYCVQFGYEYTLEEEVERLRAGVK